MITMFTGQLNEPASVLHAKGNHQGNLIDSPKQSDSAEVFVIEAPASKQSTMYTSDASGTLGFGPWSQENGNIRDDARRNFPQQYYEGKHITKNVVSYNITFKGEHNHVTPPSKVSYVQLD